MRPGATPGSSPGSSKRSNTPSTRSSLASKNKTNWLPKSSCKGLLIQKSTKTWETISMKAMLITLTTTSQQLMINLQAPLTILSSVKSQSHLKTTVTTLGFRIFQTFKSEQTLNLTRLVKKTQWWTHQTDARRIWSSWDFLTKVKAKLATSPTMLYQAQ